MDPFFLNEERNVHYIETFAKEALMKKWNYIFINHLYFLIPSSIHLKKYLSIFHALTSTI